MFRFLHPPSMSKPSPTPLGLRLGSPLAACGLRPGSAPWRRKTCGSSTGCAAFWRTAACCVFGPRASRRRCLGKKPNATRAPEGKCSFVFPLEGKTPTKGVPSFSCWRWSIHLKAAVSPMTTRGPGMRSETVWRVLAELESCSRAAQHGIQERGCVHILAMKTLHNGLTKSDRRVEGRDRHPLWRQKVGDTKQFGRGVLHPPTRKRTDPF